MSDESVILVLFVVASAVAMAARRTHLPYTIALMGVGLVLGAMHVLAPPHLTQEILYAIFLPGLIFEAAIHLRAADMFKDLWTITALVVPGVVLSTLLTAAVLIPVSHEFTQLAALGWPLAILFGAAVAATDPVSVVALFKQLGAPRRLRLLIESESLLNDGTSIVVFILALHFLQGTLSTPQAAAVDFFRIVGMGLLIGTLVGLVTAFVMRHMDDPMVTITLTTVAAYGSFLIADQLGVSGVMSTVAAGLVCGNRGFAGFLFPSIRVATETFWEYIAFALNSLIFLLMGFAIDLGMLWRLWPIVLIAYGSVVAARFVVVTGAWSLFRLTRLKFPFQWSIVMGWGGLRGALSMVLALSIPPGMAFRDLVVTLVFGVVLLSIFIQGLTMTPLTRLLGVIGTKTKVKDYEIAKTEAALARETLEELERLRSRRMLTDDSAAVLKEEFGRLLESATLKLDSLQPDRQALVQEEVLQFRRRVIMEQKAKLLEMYQSGAIGSDAYEELQKELDARLLELETLSP